MNKSKLLALVLSFNFGIFGGDVYAGNGHPLSEHTDLVGKYIVEEKKLAKSLNLFENACGIKYRQKADFFGYDELRDITLHNIYSALSEHNSIVPCYREAQSDMWDIISDYCDEILKGEYRFNELLVSLQEEMENELILGLRKLDGVSISEFNNRFERDIFKVFKLDDAISKGYLKEVNGRIFIPENKIYVMNEIINMIM